MTARSGLRRAVHATRSRPISGSGSSKFAVGGITESRSDNTEYPASIAPAAPKVCPVTPLVELTATPSPKTVPMAPPSTLSLRRVEVPWALM